MDCGIVRLLRVPLSVVILTDPSPQGAYIIYSENTHLQRTTIPDSSLFSFLPLKLTVTPSVFRLNTVPTIAVYKHLKVLAARLSFLTEQLPSTPTQSYLLSPI